MAAIKLVAFVEDAVQHSATEETDDTDISDSDDDSASPFQLSGGSITTNKEC